MMSSIEERRRREARLEDKIKSSLRSRSYLKESHGTFCGEIYADYRDTLEEKTAGEIVQSDDIWLSFEEKLESWYSDAAWDETFDLQSEIKQEIGKTEALTEEDETFVEETVQELAWFDFPRDHFLDQELCVNIMVDTGDGNYDYSLNSVYPCWCGRAQDRINDKAGIVWLARQQGYSKTQLWKSLKDGDMSDPKGFLESMRVELANLPSHMAAVTFLVKMTFRQLIELNEAIQRGEKARADQKKQKYSGYIVLDKKTMCGLYDPWSGGGSVLEVELERDVKLPIRHIRCALPDEGGYKHEYSIGSVYGLCGSAWKNTLKKIQVPKAKLETEAAV